MRKPNFMGEGGTGGKSINVQFSALGLRCAFLGSPEAGPAVFISYKCAFQHGCVRFLPRLGGKLSLRLARAAIKYMLFAGVVGVSIKQKNQPPYS